MQFDPCNLLVLLLLPQPNKNHKGSEDLHLSRAQYGVETIGRPEKDLNLYKGSSALTFTFKSTLIQLEPAVRVLEARNIKQHCSTNYSAIPRILMPYTVTYIMA